VGDLALVHYDRDEPWIILSRDLVSVPRRWLFQFEHEIATRPELPLPRALGLDLWLLVLAVTVFVSVLRYRRPPAVAGPPAAFVLLGAWLSCYHFMYYDVLLAALPVCLLFTDPRRYLDFRPWRRWAWNAVPAAALVLVIAFPYLCVWLDPSHHYPPMDLFTLLVLWAWCGWTWLRHPEAGEWTAVKARSASEEEEKTSLAHRALSSALRLPLQ
jgi:hypothetical protein